MLANCSPCCDASLGGPSAQRARSSAKLAVSNWPTCCRGYCEDSQTSTSPSMENLSRLFANDASSSNPKSCWNHGGLGPIAGLSAAQRPCVAGGRLSRDTWQVKPWADPLFHISPAASILSCILSAARNPAAMPRTPCWRHCVLRLVPPTLWPRHWSTTTAASATSAAPRLSAVPPL